LAGIWPRWVSWRIGARECRGPRRRWHLQIEADQFVRRQQSGGEGKFRRLDAIRQRLAAIARHCGLRHWPDRCHRRVASDRIDLEAGALHHRRQQALGIDDRCLQALRLAVAHQDRGDGDEILVARIATALLAQEIEADRGLVRLAIEDLAVDHGALPEGLGLAGGRDLLLHLGTGGVILAGPERFLDGVLGIR
jgi:hypothetical protein